MAAKTVWNNFEFIVPTANTVITFHKVDGTNTATEKYLGFDEPGQIIKALMIVTSSNALLTEINGEAPVNARTLIANKGFTRSGDSFLALWNQFKIMTTAANADVKVTAFTLG